MSKFEDIKKSVDEGKDPVIVLTLEDGSYQYCGIKALFVKDGKDYVAFLPIEDDPEIFFLHVKRDDEDNASFEDIDNMLEYLKVAQTYDLLMGDEQSKKLMKDLTKFGQPLAPKPTVTFNLADGSTMELVANTVFQVDGQDYVALKPVDDEDGPDYATFRLKNYNDGNIWDWTYEYIDDDDELDKVDKAYLALVEEQSKEKHGNDECTIDAVIATMLDDYDTDNEDLEDDD